MPVPKELCGTYRQVAHRLRIQKEGGGPHKQVERPRKGKRGPYTDSDENPTLIEIEADDAVDVASLLAQGALVPYDPPKPKRATKKEAAGGEAGG